MRKIMNNWKFAIDMELDGEKYYKEQAKINKDNSLNVVCPMLAEGADKELLEYLIKQEENHYEILDNMASLLIKPEEWVENAEFGIRKEY